MSKSDDLTTIEVNQYFPHSPAKLWHALTTPELMAQWLMPNDFEPVLGHRFTFRGRPIAQTGFSGVIVCRVLELTPPKRLRISWADADNADGMATEVAWTLQPEGSGTRLLLEHSGFDPDEPTQQLARRFMNGGWRSHVLRRLGELLQHTPDPIPGGMTVARTIAEKLQIKPDTELLLGPTTPELRALLDPLPAGVTVVQGIDRDTTDVAVMFAHDSAELDGLLRSTFSLFTTPPKAIWIGYPKGNKADINRDSIWKRAEEVGWTLNGNISLSDTWSSVRLKPQN